MLNQFFKFSFLSVVVILIGLTSCSKNNANEDSLTEDTSTQLFTSIVMFDIQASASAGPYGCFELVFPISIEFPDSTTSEVNDYDELKDVISTWKDANPDATERPNLVFPIEVLSEDGEVISVADKSELRDLKKSCDKDFPGHGHHGHGQCSPACFEIVYPLTVAFPDGTTQEVNDRSELKDAIRTWKDANPDATERPEVVFPIQVEMEDDGSIVDVEDRDALKALKQSCQD